MYEFYLDAVCAYLVGLDVANLVFTYAVLRLGFAIVGGVLDCRQAWHLEQLCYRVTPAIRSIVEHNYQRYTGKNWRYYAGVYNQL